jgi:peroxiredoxin
MRTIQILDPGQAGAGSGGAAAALTACALTAPPLSLPTAGNSTWELTALRQRNVVLVFIRGMRCRHCVEQLDNLLREARDLAGAGVTVVAVSGEPIADPDKAIRRLSVPPGLGFALLVDQDQRWFRAFGCYDESPLHGLFLIDKEGTVRAKYVGDVPFADPQEVCRRVRELLAPARKGLP